MVELPSFLKRCYRFPRSLEDHEDDWFFNPSRCRHRMWGKAFELSVSSEALLETTDAVELLFQFLFAKYKDNNATEDDETDEDDDYSENASDYDGLKSKIIWMSDNIFISASSLLGEQYLTDFYAYMDQGLCKVYSTYLHSNYQQEIRHDHNVYIILQTVQQQQQQAPVKIMDGMDVFLRLMAKHKHLITTKIAAHLRTIRNLDASKTEFPASLDALKAFVGEVGSERTICLHKAGLSLEQWHAVTCNCSKKVTIELDYYDVNDSSHPSFMETAIQSHCPAKVKLSHLDLAGTDKRQILLNAFESTTLLTDLDVAFVTETKEHFTLCIDTISRNRGFRSLRLVCPQYADLTLADWELFCEAIASHPTLVNVQVICNTIYYHLSRINIEKDQILIRMIRNNSALRRFEMNHNFLHNGDSFNEAVGHVLELNRFRLVAHKIKKEVDLVRRKQQFSATLSSEPVRKSLAKRYLLFKENVDMLEQVIALSESDMFCSWQKAMRHLDLVETLMRGRGMEIPSSREQDKKITWLARRRKRTRSGLPE